MYYLCHLIDLHIVLHQEFKFPCHFHIVHYLCHLNIINTITQLELTQLKNHHKNIS